MGVQYIAGVDEVGRGCLAGEVLAAAVILNPDIHIKDLNDSKKISSQKRTFLAGLIKNQALDFAIGAASVEEIDRLNILNATMLAMQRAVLALKIKPHQVVVDGNQCPSLEIPVTAIVGGDGKVPSISAASILAKVERDKQLTELHDLYPQYGFDKHKGYPTKLHLEQIKNHGVSVYHRKTFKPVQKYLNSII